MNIRIMTLVWFLTAGMWSIFGLLFLLWLHRWFFGAAFLASAGLALFIAVRHRNRERKVPGSAPAQSSSEIDNRLNG
jgi:hypothetical protein